MNVIATGISIVASTSTSSGSETGVSKVNGIGDVSVIVVAYAWAAAKQISLASASVRGSEPENGQHEI